MTVFEDIVMTTEEEDEFIDKTAMLIHRSGMDVVGIMFLEMVKPLSFIGLQLSHYFLYPFKPMLGDKISIGSDKFLTTFKKHDNVEKLISLLEKKLKEEKIERAREPKKGWRRFLPF